MGDHRHLSDSSQIWEITKHWTCPDYQAGTDMGAGIISCPYLVPVVPVVPGVRGWYCLRSCWPGWFFHSRTSTSTREPSSTLNLPVWCQLLELCTSVGQVCWLLSGMYQGMFQGMWTPDRRVVVVQNNLKWPAYVGITSFMCGQSPCTYGHLVY
jgi:hypothetical protein